MKKSILNLGKKLNIIHLKSITGGNNLPAPTEHNYCCTGSKAEWLRVYPHLSRYTCHGYQCSDNGFSDLDVY
ncbi:hypothetical protein [uncultured Tenacibaculum sp.]|uniref:hypothetical protein n=1 Tax=uncultured Tenacibaculum sp. TaxID=174713 RepID=UPI002605A1CF|nr:hypothetical protein [uncultured Tenacibaculum sp.]